MNAFYYFGSENWSHNLLSSTFAPWWKNEGRSIEPNSENKRNFERTTKHHIQRFPMIGMITLLIHFRQFTTCESQANQIGFSQQKIE